VANFWLFVHVAASVSVGLDAHRRGRRFIIWTLLTLIPYAIFVTWPLLYILPRLTPVPNVLNGAQDVPTIVDQKSSEIRNRRLTENKFFYVGVTTWVVCLLVMGVVIIAGAKSTPTTMPVQTPTTMPVPPPIKGTTPGPCQNPDDRAANGSRCGGRAASVQPGKGR
jgi:hypothetical protein